LNAASAEPNFEIRYRVFDIRSSGLYLRPMNRPTLVREIYRKKSFLCVGLDTEISKLPAHLRERPDAVLEFNRRIIDATRDLCVAYKPNLAFYEALGPAGWQILADTVAYIGNEHFIIADAKRGDIGNTSRMYAEAFFEKLGCSAITVAPYMGEDSVAPFLGFPDKWAIVLALTSNRGSADFQLTGQVGDDGDRLYEKVLRRVQTWGTPANLMFVVGATHPEAFARVRELAPDHFLLVPGVGAQGGDLAAICRYGLIPDCGLLVNASRSILYASGGEDFADAARAEAQRMQEEMAKLL
jgi:orotidine-5'-phosphate decarboxylase